MKVSITYDDTLYQLVPKIAINHYESALRYARPEGLTWAAFEHRTHARNAVSAAPTLPTQPEQPPEFHNCTLSNDSLPGECNCAISPEDQLKYAMRYAFLRSRDLDSIKSGGVFAGMTPSNVVLNGDDLDAEIDRATEAASKGES